MAGRGREAWLGTADFIPCAGGATDADEQWVCCTEPLSPGGGGPGTPPSLSRATRAGGAQGAVWTWLGEPRLCVDITPSAPQDGVSPTSGRGAGRPWVTPGAFAWLDQRGWGARCVLRALLFSLVLGGDRLGAHLRWEGGVDWTGKTEKGHWSHSLAVSPAPSECSARLLLTDGEVYLVLGLEDSVLLR